MNLNKYFSLFLFLLITASAYAQPANDNPCSATALTVGSSCNYTTYTNLNATSTAGVTAPGCASYSGADVWFTAVVPSSGVLTLTGNSVSGGFADGGMAVYTGTCGALTLLECDDDDGPASMPMIAISNPALANQTVYIRFWRYNSTSGGNFQLCAYSCVPTNNTCAQSTTMLVNTPLVGTTTCATTNSDDPTNTQICATTIENTVWYVFTPTSTGQYQVEFSNYSCSSGSGLQMGVLTGPCGGPYTSLTCATGDPGGPMNFTGTAGTTYYIVVDGVAGAECTFTFEVEPYCNQNSTCATALAVPGLTGVNTQVCVTDVCNINGTDNSGNTSGSDCGDVRGATKWFSFTTDAGDGLLDLSAISSDFNPHIQVFSACGTYIASYCDVGNGTTAGLAQLPVTGSTTYYIVVAPASGIGEGEFDLCITSYPNPCNPSDDCNAPTVFPALVSGTPSCLNNECNLGATQLAPSTIGCGTLQGPVVWYQVTTVAQLLDVSVSSSDITDPLIQIWDDCDTYMVNGCANGTGGSATLQGYNAGTGNTYLISVSSASGNFSGDFNLCVESYPDLAPCNKSDTIRIVSSTPAADANGNYLPGSTLNVCYDLRKFAHGGYNFLHGAVPTLGDAYDLTTLTPTTTPVPQAINESGSQWAWFPAGTVLYNNLGASGKYPAGTPIGTGWFFQSVNSPSAPSPISSLDPDNSWGDGCTDGIRTGYTNGTCTGDGGTWLGAGQCYFTCLVDVTDGFNYDWTFCFSVQTKATYDCTSPQNFQIRMETFGDGETGIWTDLGCVNDAPNIKYLSAPTPAPLILSIDSTRNPLCNGQSNGYIYTSAIGGYGTLQYSINGGAFSATNDYTGLAAGTYTITVRDQILCTNSFTVTLANPVVPSAPKLTANGPLCVGQTLNLYADTVGGVTAYTWTGPNSFSSAIQNPSIPSVTTAAGGTYTYSVTQNGCQSATGTVSVDVNANPTVSITPATSSVCASSSINLNGGAAGGSGVYTHSWTGQTTPLSGTAIVNPVFNTSTAGTYNFTYTVTDDNGCSASGTKSVTVNANPVVTTVSSTNVSVCGGSNGTITITATGTPTLNYSINGGTTYSGSGSFTNLSQGSYTVIVKDGNTCTTTYGVVNIADGGAPPMPTATSEDTVRICNGGVLPTFTVSNAGYNYNWWTNSTLTTLAPGTNNTTSYTPTTSPAAGTSVTYYATASAAGCKSLGYPFVLVVYNSISAGTVTASQTICSGDNPVAFTETVTASGGNTGAGYTYSWESATAPGGPWTAIAGATSSTYDPPVLTNATTAAVIYYYRRVVINTCGNAATAAVAITVNPNPTVNAISNITVCPGQTINPGTFTSPVSGSTINWSADANYSLVGLSTQTGTGSITSYTAPANNGSTNISSVITVTATNNSCTGASASFTIAVKPTPVVNQLSDISVCPGANISVPNFSTTWGAGTYAWNTPTTNVVGLPATSGTTNIGSFTAAANSTGSTQSNVINYSATINGCASTGKSFAISVYPTPTVAAIADQIACPSAIVNIPNFSSTPAGATFNWTNSDINIFPATSGTGNLGGWNVPSNNTGVNDTSYVVVTPVLNSCAGTPRTVHLIVKPTPSVTAINDQFACPGSTVSVALTSTPSGSFSWTNDNTLTGQSANGTTNISFTAASNSGTSNIVGNVSVIATANGCASSAEAFTVNIYPTPVVNAISNVAACSGGPVDMPVFSSNLGSSTYSWTNSNTATTINANGTGDIADFTAPVIGSTSVSGTISVTALNNTCPSSPRTFTVTINPKPLLNAISDVTVCPSQNVSPVVFSLNPTLGGTTTYSWFNTNTGVGLGANGAGNTPSFTSSSNLTGSNITSIVDVVATNTGCGSDTASFNIIIRPTPVAVPLSNVSSCPGGSISAINFTSTPSSGILNFNWTNNNTSIGLTGFGTGNIPTWTAPANATGSPINGNVIYTPTLDGCTGVSDTITVSITSDDDGSVTYPSLTVCSTGSNPIPTTIATPGGTFVIDNGASINPATGEVDMTTVSGGTTYNISYTTNGACPVTSNYPLNVQSSTLNADFTYPREACQNGSNITPVLIGGNGTYSLSSVVSGGPNLVFGNTSTGVINVAASDTGTYIVVNTIPASGGCAGANDTSIVTIKGLPDATFNAIAANYCNNANVVSLTPNTLGGTFTGNGVTGNTFDPSAIGSTGLTSVTYTVTVNGCTTTSTQNTNIHAAPNVIAVANDDTLCFSELLTLTGSGTANIYVWDNSVVDGAAFMPSAGSYTYVVTGTDGNNCSNTDTIDVLVNALPVVTVNNETICFGQSSVLTAGGADTYSWSTTEITTSITVNPNDTTVYYVVGTDLNGCSNIDTSIVNVNTLPVINITSSANSVCAGDSVALTAVGDISSFSWSTLETDTVIYVVPVGPSTSYTLYSTNANSCSDSVSVNIIVNANPTTLINNSITYSTSVCYGGSVTLTGGGVSTYEWSDGNTSVSNLFTPLSDTTLVLTGTDANGCEDTAVAVVLVTPPINLTVSSDTICLGAVASLTASGAATYNWPSLGASSATVSITPADTGVFNYNVIGTDVNNCQLNGTGTVVVNENPMLTVSSDTIEICEGQIASITAGGAITYVWDNGQTGATINVSPATDSTFTVVGENSFGCTSSKEVFVKVNINPIALINNENIHDTAICTNSTISLNGSGSGAFSYSWSTGETNQNINSSVTSNSSYSLVVTSVEGCTDTAYANVSTFALPNITGTDVSVCPGVTAISVASGGLSYQWSNGTLDDSLIVNPSITTTYGVTGTDVNGCSNTDSVTVTILEEPVISTSNVEICKGETATLLVTGNATSYSWDNGMTGSPISVSPLNSTVYIVTASNGNCTAVDTAVVNVKSVATVTATGNGVDAVCMQPNGAIVGVAVTNAVTTEWVNASGAVVSSQVNPTGLAPGTYTLITTSSDGCVTPNTPSIVVNSTPKADASFTMSDSSGIVPLQVQFTNTSTSPAGISIIDYEWSFGDPSSSTTNVISPNFTYYFGDTQDTIMMIITDNNGCKDTAIAYVNLTEPQDSIFIPNVFSPNDDGKNDVFFVKSYLIQDLDVTIYNRWGQLIYEYTGTNTGWDGRTTAGQAAPEGTYYYMIEGKLKDGTEIPERFKRGAVTLVR